MGGMLYKVFAAASLLSLGFYHLICSLWHLMKSSQSFAAKPFYPFTCLSNHRLHNLPFFLLIFSIFFAFLHQTLISFYSDPLVKGSTPVHGFSTVNSAAILFLFLLVAVCLLLSESTSFALSPLISFSSSHPPLSSSTTRSPHLLPPSKPPISRPIATPSPLASPPFAPSSACFSPAALGSLWPTLPLLLLFACRASGSSRLDFPFMSMASSPKVATACSTSRTASKAPSSVISRIPK